MNVLLHDLTKTFGDISAVEKLNLDIRSGEFFSLLGPSGCGKTTTLRLIAGFEQPTAGRILFDDRDITFLPPHRRNTGMVFQNYALFPHMTVFENVAFGLQARRVPKADIRKRVRDALALVELSDFESRPATELSGGQQQRVALARAVVIEPGILLLDEPLSNLDAKLREETRGQILALQRRLAITTIYVTHDQEEALSLSDRIAVMHEGVCHQVGTPEEIYQRPRDRFVAAFVGNSNILEGTYVGQRNGLAEVALADDWRLRFHSETNGPLASGAPIALALKPEAVTFAKGEAENSFEGEIHSISFSGATVEYGIEAHGRRLRARRLVGPEDFAQRVGDRVRLTVEPTHLRPVA